MSWAATDCSRTPWCRAHEIRLLRNIGAHPDEDEVEVAADDARDIVKFLDYFLIYALNVPKEIDDYKQRHGAPRRARTRK